MFTTSFLAHNGHGAIKTDKVIGKVIPPPGDRIEPLMNSGLQSDRAHKRINDLIFDGDLTPIQNIFGIKSIATHHYFE